MDRIGVMPIPPARKMYRGTECSGKWLRGPRTAIWSPAWSVSWTRREPPRPFGSRSTAIRQECWSPGVPHREYWRTVSSSSRSMCAPGVQAGS